MWLSSPFFWNKASAVPAIIKAIESVLSQSDRGFSCTMSSTLSILGNILQLKCNKVLGEVEWSRIYCCD